MRQIAAILLVGVLAGTAWAQLPMHSPPLGTKAAFVGPGTLISFAGWWGVRPYSAAKVGNVAANLIRASDSHTCDVLNSVSAGLGNTANCSTGGDNGTAAATWCNATTCSVTKLYDQTQGNNCGGGSCDMAQATGAKRPTITFSCLGIFPCMTFSGTQLLTVGTSPGGAGSPQDYVVAERTTVASVSDMLSPSVHEHWASSANTWNYGSGGASPCSGTANDNAWHAAGGNCGASGVYNIDGTNICSRSLTCNNVGSSMDFAGFNNSASFTGHIMEGGTPSGAITNTGLNTLCHNANAYYSLGLSC